MGKIRISKQCLCMMLIMTVVLVVILNGIVVIKYKCAGAGNNLCISEGFRNLDIAGGGRDALYYVEQRDADKRIIGIDENSLRDIVYQNMYSCVDNDAEKSCPLLFRYIADEDEYRNCYKTMYSLLADIRYFPVAADSMMGIKSPYENSWGSARSYGGNRSHEGTDIMAGNNQRGYFPVISMTDGVVEKIGWMELGGYRIGIRSNSGAYFYYAHMCEYAEGIVEGSTVKAGMILGTMGDTGYSKIEGTTGQFAVHLHLGMYYDNEGTEVSYNPYYVLRMIEPFRLDYISSQG